MIELERALADVLSREEPVALPSPLLALAIDALAGGVDLRIDDLTRLALADPAVAAELLAAANAEGGEIASLPEAAARLGEPQVLRIARGATPGGASAMDGPIASLRHRAGEAAVVSALLCRELARARGLPAEEAYACGLLHDIGVLAALAAVERLAAGARPSRAVPLWRWAELAGRWRVPLGVAYAEHRRFPRSIVEAIRSHHDGDAPAASPLVHVVRSVAALLTVLEEGRDPAEAVALADVTDAEAGRLARALECADAHLSALARLVPRRMGAGGAADAADLPALREPKGRGMRLWLAGREYAAVGFGAHQLLVSGPAPLGEGALLPVEFLDRRRAAFHARVLAGWAEGDRFGAILVPFGLSGPEVADFGGVLPAGASA